ncbi:MAG TPA: hypothetical protein VNX28_17245 [Gemmataceae bacterium]|nr:hypothetical protein [Gemmataceae bacterium]
MLAQWLSLLQQLGQRFLDAILPLMRRHVQQPHIFPVCTLRLLRLERVIRPPKRHTRVQLFAVHIARKCPRLPHQPVDYVPIVDPVLALTTQALHRLHPRPRVPHLDLVRTDPRFHPFPDQPRRHRVRVLLHLDRAPLAHTHPRPFQRLQPLYRQRMKPCLILPKLLPTARVPPRHQRPHELPVVLAAAEVTTATQQQGLVQLLLETPMPLLAITVLVAARRIRRLGRHAIMPQ